MTKKFPREKISNKLKEKKIKKNVFPGEKNFLEKKIRKKCPREKNSENFSKKSVFFSLKIKQNKNSHQKIDF